MKKKLEFSEKEGLIPTKYPKHNIRKVYMDSMLAIFVNGTENSITIILSVPVFREKNFKEVNAKEIDLIQFGSQNIPNEKLNTLAWEEIFYLMDKSAKSAVKAINEVIRAKYPLSPILVDYTPKQLKDTWNGMWEQNKQRNEGLFSNWGNFGVA